MNNSRCVTPPAGMEPVGEFGQAPVVTADRSLHCLRKTCVFVSAFFLLAGIKYVSTCHNLPLAFAIRDLVHYLPMAHGQRGPEGGKAERWSGFSSALTACQAYLRFSGLNLRRMLVAEEKPTAFVTAALLMLTSAPLLTQPTGVLNWAAAEQLNSSVRCWLCGSAETLMQVIALQSA